jgi:acyl-CoA synthetase (AMP-forming)/AMP-acid ligase II
MPMERKRMSPTGSSVEGCGGQVTRPVSLVEPFARSAEASPDKLCLRFEGEDWSNGRLLDRAGSFAAALRAWGLKPGDRVALFLGNHPDFLAAYLGTHLARGVTVPVNKSYRRTELRHIFEDAGVRLCVADGEARPELERVRDDLSSLERVVVRGDALTEEKVVDFCREDLAGYKKPRRVEFVGALPRNALGKVLTHKVREKLIEGER